ncbi:hypothetical protein FK535_24415 [Mycolicibacterium sp. 018/SC-01/001]|nr:hypothetical protein FK535_24415 [Mycolicibacterium sp. 018/SC-01/001]
MSIVAASLGTLAIAVVLLISRPPTALEVQSIPARPAPVQQSVAEPAQPSLQPSPQASRQPPPAPPPAPRPAPAAPAPAGLPMDSNGYIDSAARCDSGQQAVAVARTERAAVAVCRGDDGYSYHGVRLRDGAALRSDDVRLIPAGFEARNGTTTYRLTDTELVVIDGEALQSRDPVIEYRAG